MNEAGVYASTDYTLPIGADYRTTVFTDGSGNEIVFRTNDDGTITKTVNGVDVATSEPAQSVWTPANTTTEMWWDANDETTLELTNVNQVSKWKDKSGNGRDAMGVTHLPAYDNVAKKINANTSKLAFSEFESGNGITTFYVASFSYIPNTTIPYNLDSIILAYSSGSIKDYSHGARSDKCALYGENNSSVGLLSNETVQIGEEFLSAAHAGIDSIYINKNGSPIVSGAGLSNNLIVRALFQDSGSSYFYGSVSEVIVTDTITTEERQKFEGYLAWKWDNINGNTNLVNALPILHPYKNNPPIV